MELNKILFFDIETASGLESFDLLPYNLKEEWIKKSYYIYGMKHDPYITYKEKAALFPEFGRIVCFSCGYFIFDQNNKVLIPKVMSIGGANEEDILNKISEKISKIPTWSLAGHNIKNFDIPYLVKRYIIKGIDVPSLFNVIGKKKWEINLIDTLELWQCNDWKNFSSLNLITSALEYESPKEDFNGSMVSKFFWQYPDELDKIYVYCQRDVVATMNLYKAIVN